VVASGTYTLNWLRRFNTDFTLFYSGTSGAPHDYIYGQGGSTGSGDLNGDGRQGNDLIYIPKSATDPSEIQFRDIVANGAVRLTAAQQAANLDKFISESECLSGSRGTILSRNTCRLPFLNRVDFSVRQAIDYFGTRRLSVQLDIFNFGNLLNKDWGKELISPRSSNSNVPLLTHVGQSSSDPKVAVPVVQFDNVQNNIEYQAGTFVSNFWRTQLSVRLSF
jgi:hypothetical protein